MKRVSEEEAKEKSKQRHKSNMKQSMTKMIEERTWSKERAGRKSLVCVVIGTATTTTTE